MRPTSLVLTDEEIDNFGEGGYPDWGRVRATLQHLQSKWEFEHTLAVGQEAEIKRLDGEVLWLQNYGRVPQLEALLRDVGPCVRHCDQHAASLAGRIDAALGPTEYTVHHPSYVVPPADPLLANPIEKKRPPRPQER